MAMSCAEAQKEYVLLAFSLPFRRLIPLALLDRLLIPRRLAKLARLQPARHAFPQPAALIRVLRRERAYALRHNQER